LVDSKLTRGAVNKLLGQIPADLDSATIGMGLSIQDPEALKLLVKSLLARDVRISLDATALVNYILPLLSGKNAVVTPHAGEFKKMFGEVPPESKKARIIMVEKFAKEHSVTILLKGPTDIISNGARTYLNPTNTSGMTVGGTGDILSGIIAGMLARNRDALESAVISAYFNGLAGKMIQKKLGHHMTATDLLDVLPTVMKSFDKIK
jgi:NAD(P)H-hydrate epimerase